MTQAIGGPRFGNAPGVPAAPAGPGAAAPAGPGAAAAGPSPAVAAGPSPAAAASKPAGPAGAGAVGGAGGGDPMAELAQLLGGGGPQFGQGAKLNTLA